MERNVFLESDGLFYESETHEWFHDKSFTNYSRKKSVLWGSGEQDDVLDVACFVIRNKETGEYDRVMMDRPTNKIVYVTKVMEDMGCHIDMLKALKRFGNE